MNPQLYTQPNSDYNLSNLASRDGLIETIPLLNLELEDRYIIKTLHDTIEKSRGFYDDVNEFNLKNKRLKNEQMLQGKHLQDHKLYRHQTPYIDNEMFVGVDAIVSYVTAQTPRAEVYPANETTEARVMATDLESYLHAHSEKFELPRKMEGAVYNMLGKYLGLIKLRWDALYGAQGELVPEVVDPNHVIIDKNAKLGDNPRFICHVLKDTIEGLIARFPDKEDEIKTAFTIKRKSSQNISAEVAYREVWFTYYDKQNKPQEAVAWYTMDLVLDKRKNPHWLYEGEGENFLDAPMKPFIPFNLTNDGSNWLDRTNAVEQAIAQQEILNKLGRQIIDNLSTANGFKVLDAHAMRSEDAQNFTGDPNQVLLVKTKPNQSVKDVVAQLDPQIVSEQLIHQASDTRQTIHGILGTPSQFRGDDEDQTKTASEAMLIKNQSSGRQDKIVRSIDYAMDSYFKLLTQMITVWYDGKHYATVNGGDGNFDFIEMHKNKVNKGMTVRVQSGTTLPFDKARQESVAQNAAQLDLLAPYDYYKLMHMDNPQKLYDNLVKWKTQPQELVMDLASNDADRFAIVDFTELMGGKKVEPRIDPTPEYLEQLRKLMVSDDFLKAKAATRNNVIKFVRKAADSLAVRTELEQEAAQPVPPAPVPPQVQATLPPPPPMNPMPPPMPPPPGSPIQAIMQSTPLGAPPPPAPAPALNPAQPQPPVPGSSALPPF